jgi:hypothetical protein
MEAGMTVVRTAIGRFAPEQHDAVARELADSEASLREAIEGLDGLIHFYAAVDSERSYVANVSVWTTSEAAHQMDSLRAMLERRPLLEQAGVHFEATTNHETVWEIVP